MNVRGSARCSLPRVLLCIVVLVFGGVSGCRRPTVERASLSLLDAGWLQQDEVPRVERELQDFTRETGIAIHHPPVPETLFSSLDPLPQLDLLRKVLRENGPSPDVLGIDVIWPKILAEDLMDLRPYFAKELSSLDPRLVSSYTENGKVVAIPYQVHIAVLAYRTDLLRQYGYRRPPESWDELESMAARIQAGERAKGRRNFWGYIWQGAPSEGLTCNALEWQVSEGGGHVVEDDQTISVNNPAASRAWRRAAHWIGAISPPSVLAYRETDTLNVWDSGNAAFMRSWMTGKRLVYPRRSPLLDKTGYTSMPGGRQARVDTLGGVGLAIPRSSAHPQEAVELVRFLIARDWPSAANSIGSRQPIEAYDLPQALQGYAQSAQGSRRSQLLIRPSNVAGNAYEGVTKAYIQAVHSVLTGQRKAPEAAAALEKQLIQLTGFRPGPAQK